MQNIILTENQRLYLQRIFDYLQEHIQWPTHHELDEWFNTFYPDLDIEEIEKSLPPGLTSEVDFSRPDNLATLTIPAIYLLENNALILNSFIWIIEHCESTYFSANGPVVSSNDFVPDDSPLWNTAFDIAGYLLAQEPSIWSNFNGPDAGHWECTLNRKVRRFRGITTIEDYLEKRDWTPEMPYSSPVSNNVTDHAGTTIPVQDVQLHPVIYKECWHFYMQDDYGIAIFNATKAIEVAVRQKAQLAKDLVGTAVITQAFNVKDPILYYSDVNSEQEGMMAFLRGIIQVYKNPQSHRHVEVQDKMECLSLLLLCSNLLYMIEKVENLKERLSMSRSKSPSIKIGKESHEARETMGRFK